MSEAQQAAVTVTEDDFIPFDPPTEIIYKATLASAELVKKPADDKYNPNQKQMVMNFRFDHDPELPESVRKMVGGQLATGFWPLNGAQYARFCRTFNLEPMSFASDPKTWTNLPVRMRITKKPGVRKFMDEDGVEQQEPRVRVQPDMIFARERA